MKSTVRAQSNRCQLLSWSTLALLTGVLAPTLAAAGPQARSVAKRVRTTNRPTLEAIMAMQSQCMEGWNSTDLRAKVLYEALARVFDTQVCIEKISDTDSPSKPGCVIEIENLAIYDEAPEILSTFIFVSTKDTSGNLVTTYRTVAEVGSNTKVDELLGKNRSSGESWGSIPTNDFNNTLACVSSTDAQTEANQRRLEDFTKFAGDYTVQPSYDPATDTRAIPSPCPKTAHLTLDRSENRLTLSFPQVGYPAYDIPIQASSDARALSATPRATTSKSMTISLAQAMNEPSWMSILIGDSSQPASNPIRCLYKQQN